jgi:hypothetical protein
MIQVFTVLAISTVRGCKAFASSTGSSDRIPRLIILTVVFISSLPGAELEWATSLEATHSERRPPSCVLARPKFQIEVLNCRRDSMGRATLEHIHSNRFARADGGKK